VKVPGRTELALHQVPRLRARVGDRRPPKSSRTPADQAGLAHQTSNPLATNALATVAKFSMDARRTVCAAAVVVDNFDLIRELLVGTSSGRRLPCLPRVERALGYVQHAA
jgi:hypothetical protein